MAAQRGPIAKERLLFISIDDLDLETKVAGMLRSLKLEYLGQVASQTPHKFQGLFRYGRKTVRLLEDHLKKLGLALGDAPEEWAELTPEEFREQYSTEIRSARKEFATKSIASSSLEDDFQNILGVAKDQRNKELIAARYGWNGKAPATLQEVGDSLGSLTRERVRQICSRFEEKISAKKVIVPSVARALSVCAEAAPASEAFLSDLLVREGIASSRVSIEGVINAAKLAKLKPKIESAAPPFAHFFVPLGGSTIPGAASRYARQKLSSRGVLNYLQLADHVLSETKLVVTPDALEEILKHQDGYVRFDDFPGWFWFRTSRNRLLNVFRKMFAVSDRLHVSEVRSAVQRSRRLEGFAPPQRVLLGVAAQVAEFQVEDEFIRRAEGTDTAGWIEGTEATFYSVLKRAGGVLDRASLTRECLAEGMNEITLQIYLGSSPIIQNLGRGAFALIGADYSEQSIEQYQRPRGVRAVIDHSWTSEGHIRVRYRVTDHILYTGFVPIPSQFSEYLARQQFEIHDAGATPLGAVLKTKDAQAWGLKRLLNAMGAEAGDPFELSFNLGTKVASMSFGELTEGD